MPITKTYRDNPVDWSLLTKPYKMIVYINADGCESCKMQILESMHKIVVETMPFEKFGVVVILHPSHFEVPDYFLEQIQYEFTIFYDLDGSFERINPQLPQNEKFHIFLLDDNNKVIIVGNPVNSPKLMKLYFEILKEKHQ